MDSQDNKVLAARIRSSLNPPAHLPPERYAYLRERLLDRASQQAILPPSPLARLKRRLQDAIQALEVALMDEGRYHRAYYERAIHLSRHNQRHRLGWMSGDYLEPLRYTMMKINVC